MCECVSVCVVSVHQFHVLLFILFSCTFETYTVVKNRVHMKYSYMETLSKHFQPMQSNTLRV